MIPTHADFGAGADGLLPTQAGRSICSFMHFYARRINYALAIIWQN